LKNTEGAVSIIAVSAGEVNTGRFATTREEMIKIRALANTYGAWVHVDGGTYAIPSQSYNQRLIKLQLSVFKPAFYFPARNMTPSSTVYLPSISPTLLQATRTSC
jgi:hypothetical protein